MYLELLTNQMSQEDIKEMAGIFDKKCKVLTLSYINDCLYIAISEFLRKAKHCFEEAPYQMQNIFELMDRYKRARDVTGISADRANMSVSLGTEINVDKGTFEAMNTLYKAMFGDYFVSNCGKSMASFCLVDSNLTDSYMNLLREVELILNKVKSSGISKNETSEDKPQSFIPKLTVTITIEGDFQPERDSGSNYLGWKDEKKRVVPRTYDGVVNTLGLTYRDVIDTIYLCRNFKSTFK